MLIQIGKFNKGLSDIIKAFFYNYRTFGLTADDHASYATYAEIDYFRKLGEMLNFATEKEAKRSPSDRPADLVWVDDWQEYYYSVTDLVLHLERETRGWEKIQPTVEKLFNAKQKKNIPMGIAIIDNVPESKVDDTVKIFKDKFYSKKVFKEFALLIYRYYDKENRIKPILTNIFSLENPEIITIDAKFEYVGSCDEGDAADFVIVSY